MSEHDPLRTLLLELALAVGMIACLVGAMFIHTGSMPPLVVVESKSMIHEEGGELGSIDAGDLILVHDQPGDTIVTYAEATDPSNPACSACAMDPASCTVMPQAMWTDHCLQDGDSDFATGLETPETDLVVQKGVNQNIDAYSVFMDNAKIHKTALDETLKEHGIQRLFVVGIATDFCVSWTAQDAVDLGYEVYVIEDATAPIGLPVGDGMTTVDVAMGEMEAKGVKVITMDDMTSMMCPGRRKLAEEKPKGRVLELY